MTQDQALALLAAARPLIALLVGLGGAVGLYATAHEGAIVQGIIAVFTAGIPFGLMVWGYIAHKNQTALTQSAAQHAFAAGSQDGVVPVAAYSNTAVVAAQAAVASARAIVR